MKKILPIISFSALITISCAQALDLSSALTESDKALQNSTSQIAWFLQSGDAASNDLIIQSLHNKWITIYETRNDFKPNQNIRRDEAAKMLTLAVSELWTDLKSANVSCSFSDTDKAWKDLVDVLKESCEKWLFKWSNWKFNPQNSITNWQILTVLWRMLYGVQDESVGHYATKYVTLLENDWYLENLSIPFSERDKPAERWTLAKLLIRVIE